jgi:hypothetical protein
VLAGAVLAGAVLAGAVLAGAVLAGAVAVIVTVAAGSAELVVPPQAVSSAPAPIRPARPMDRRIADLENFIAGSSRR